MAILRTGYEADDFKHLEGIKTQNTRKPEIVIKTDGTSAMIFVDGVKLDGVIGYELIQSSKMNEGLPRLLVEIKATNVTLETKLIPELPVPFKNHYVSISKLEESGMISKDKLNRLLKTVGIELL